MKAKIIVTDDSGATFEHEFELTAVDASATAHVYRTSKPTARPRTSPRKQVAAPAEVDLSLPARPFMKRYGAKKTGAQRFTLLVAQMAGGDEEKQIARTDLEKQWNRMTELMGGEFNSAHTTRAKDKGWVDSPKHGHYRLLPGWKGALTNA